LHYWAISELPLASLETGVIMKNLSFENEFDVNENELVVKVHFHMNGDSF